MKKLISLFVALLSASFSFAQYNDSYNENESEVIDSLQNELDLLKAENEQLKDTQKIWGKGRYFRLGYALSQTSDGINPVEKSDFSFFLTKGTSYLFPSKPIAGLLKIGVDVIWGDIQFSKYKDTDDGEWTYDMSTSDSDDEDYGFNMNLGHMALTAGMGIGPNVTVAPFAKSNVKGLQYLKASLYFHYKPTYGMYFCSLDDDIELSTAFCNMFDFGGNITYRKIAIGIEGHWGNGKFKPLDFDSLLGEGEESLGTNKYKRKFASTRLYLQFTF